jgi:hypothetical protein
MSTKTTIEDHLSALVELVNEEGGHVGCGFHWGNGYVNGCSHAVHGDISQLTFVFIGEDRKSYRIPPFPNRLAFRTSIGAVPSDALDFAVIRVTDPVEYGGAYLAPPDVAREWADASKNVASLVDVNMRCSSDQRDKAWLRFGATDDTFLMWLEGGVIQKMSVTLTEPAQERTEDFISYSPTDKNVLQPGMSGAILVGKSGQHLTPLGMHCSGTPNKGRALSWEYVRARNSNFSNLVDVGALYAYSQLEGDLGVSTCDKVLDNLLTPTNTICDAGWLCLMKMPNLRASSKYHIYSNKYISWELRGESIHDRTLEQFHAFTGMAAVEEWFNERDNTEQFSVLRIEHSLCPNEDRSGLEDLLCFAFRNETKPTRPPQKKLGIIHLHGTVDEDGCFTATAMNARFAGSERKQISALVEKRFAPLLEKVGDPWKGGPVNLSDVSDETPIPLYQECHRRTQNGRKGKKKGAAVCLLARQDVSVNTSKLVDWLGSLVTRSPERAPVIHKVTYTTCMVKTGAGESKDTQRPPDFDVESFTWGCRE